MNPEDTTTESERTPSHRRRSASSSAGPTTTACWAAWPGAWPATSASTPMIVRIAFVVLTFVGGAGIPLYLAGLLLIPDEGSDQSIAGSIIESLQSRSR